MNYAARSVVLKALRAACPPHCPHKLSVTEHEGWWVSVSDNVKWTILEYIPPETNPRTINHLSERFCIPKVWFYDSFAIADESGTVN